MSNYMLNSTDDTKKIIKITKKKSYSFSSKNKKYTYVKNISIFNKDEIEKIIVKKLTKKIKNLHLILEDLFGSDDINPSDWIICLDENYKLQEILKTKFKEYLRLEYFEVFLNQLCMDAKVLENKIIDMNNIYEQYNNQNYYEEEEKGKGR